jgi:phage baseplate assembly protein W
LPVKYYPEDQQDSGYVGIRFPTNGNGSSNGGFFNMSRSTEEQAVTNYINLLLTKPGERFYHPNYGVYLQGKLFEPNTPALQTEIEFTIRQQAAIWLPYIFNHNVEVRGDGSKVNGLNGTDIDNAIQIVITFSVTEKGANKQITLFQNQGRVSYIVE